MLVLSLNFGVAAALAPSPAPLRSAGQVRALSATQANAQLPVSLRATVVYFEASPHPDRGTAKPQIYIWDGSNGLYVVPKDGALRLRPGMRVAIKGVSGAGDFTPILYAEHVSVLGRGPLPEAARSAPLSQVQTGDLDAQWIRVNGLVRSEQVRDGFLLLRIEQDGAVLPVRVLLQRDAAVPALVDSEVSMTGVCATLFDRDRRQHGEELYLASPSQIRVTVAPSDPFSGPAIPIAALPRFLPHGGSSGHRVLVQGVVTSQAGDGRFTLQDRTGAVFVAGNPRRVFQIGAPVEVAGFARLLDSSLVLRDPEARPGGPQLAITPLQLPRHEPAEARFNNRLVRATARLVSVESSHADQQQYLHMELDGYYFEALLPGARTPSVVKSLRPGSILRLTGVYWGGADGRSLRLLLRRGSDIVVVRRPSWWNLRHVFWLLGVLCAAGLLVLAWVWLLREQLARQERLLRAQMREHHELERRIQQTHRLEAVGRLAGGVAHDFNNLLTVIIGRAEVLAEEHNLPAPWAEGLREIIAAGERAAVLTKKLLAYGRCQMLQEVELDLNQVVRETGPLLRSLLGEDRQLVFALSTDLLPVLADPTQLEQVIMNLVVNARDAMPDSGTLTITTRNVWLAAAEIADLPGLHPGQHVCVSVSDTGSGMPPEIQSRIFEPFFTTKEDKGTGLGLATVYGIISQSGGGIRVRSEVGKGSTFSIFFPASANYPASSIAMLSDGAPDYLNSGGADGGAGS